MLKCKGIGVFWMMVSVRIDVIGIYLEKVRLGENIILKMREGFEELYEGRE